MDVDVVGRKDEVPDELRERAKAKVAKLGRLAPVLERAEVRLAEDRDAPVASRKLCEVTLTGHGHTVRASAVAHDLAEAVDKVVDKLEHQVERLKGKLIDRSHSRRSQGQAGTSATAPGPAPDEAPGEADDGLEAGEELGAEV
ncbi:MAG TPA: ribosome-associated translation inhibitor RaiA [Acidimicrobiales bacterium]|nr:ribosome-associated translation inhibitor RaiA [Acidimicrobiales bacterium]